MLLYFSAELGLDGASGFQCSRASYPVFQLSQVRCKKVTGVRKLQVRPNIMEQVGGSKRIKATGI